MPTPAEHVARAAHNEALSRSLESTPYTGWAVTALFYAALHLVDAYLLGLGIDPKAHGERLRQMTRTGVLRPIWARYRNLMDRSLDARYECQTFTTAQVTMLRTHTFEPVKQHLRTLLGL